MKQTSLQGIANKATQDKTYRFRNLFGLLTVGYLFWCWDFINKKASAGVDRIDAQVYEANLLPNIDQLVQQVKANVNQRAKLTRVLGETALKSFHPRLYKIRYFIGASWSVRNGYYCGSQKATSCQWRVN